MGEGAGGPRSPRGRTQVAPQPRDKVCLGTGRGSWERDLGGSRGARCLKTQTCGLFAPQLLVGGLKAFLRPSPRGNLVGPEPGLGEQAFLKEEAAGQTSKGQRGPGSRVQDGTVTVAAHARGAPVAETPF